MSGSQISTGITIINSLLGFNGVSLTNQTTSASTAIAAGSKVEIAGAFFTFGSDETPLASTWTNLISVASTGYIALTPSGTAGSQIVSASWVTAGNVVWSESKQGYYTSAASNIRVIGSAYKTSATQYDYKRILTQRIENLIPGNSVPNSSLSNMSSATVKGQTVGGSGSPVDLTASQLLTIIETVDGSGSGLDADLLDGLNSTDFVRSNANASYIDTSSAITGNTVFDTISVNIPDVNDYLPLSGYILLSGSFYLALYAKRTSSTQIAIYRYKVSVPGFSNMTADDGDGATFADELHIVWGPM
jgi:hypothetical protein